MIKQSSERGLKDYRTSCPWLGKVVVLMWLLMINLYSFNFYGLIFFYETVTYTYLQKVTFLLIFLNYNESIEVSSWYSMWRLTLPHLL